jgi:hypothetical protein
MATGFAGMTNEMRSNASKAEFNYGSIHMHSAREGINLDRQSVISQLNPVRNRDLRNMDNTLTENTFHDANLAASVEMSHRSNEESKLNYNEVPRGY